MPQLCLIIDLVTKIHLDGVIKMKGKSSIMSQMEKAFRHARAGSFGTRARYKSSCAQFVSFLEERFKMKNLRNLQNKHLVEFIKSRQEEGIHPKTLKNDLGAIRYLHDQISNAKHELSSNQELKKQYKVHLDKTPAVKGDRGWTKEEYNNMRAIAQDAGTTTGNDVRDVLTLCRTMGLRVTEAIAVHRSQVEDALRTGVYQVKSEAKNGKWRKVPLSTEAKQLFEERREVTKRGERLFVQSHEKTHQAVNRVVKFLQYHRINCETKEGRRKRGYRGKTNPITFHGLRYDYVREQMENEIEKGLSYNQAADRVTKKVGHERIDVIKIYLAMCKK